MPLPRDGRSTSARPTLPTGTWLMIGVLALVTCWQTWLVERQAKQLDTLRVRINGLPQVVEKEMDCGCVRCECCRCKKGD